MKSAKLLKPISAAALASLLSLPAFGFEMVLLDENTKAANQTITSNSIGINLQKPFSITTKTLHGGRQEGVMLVEIDTGEMKLTVVPTRGMNVLSATSGSGKDAVRMGWDSPVKEVVNPAFINLESRGGLGWLEGFNELVTRCGFEWVGHPGIDNGEMLTLHGLASNIPASKLILKIDEKPPYKISLHGEIREQAFKKVDFLVDASVFTFAGAKSFTVKDTLTNQGDYEKEYQALYHSNFGTPLLGEGAKFAAPVREVSPFNEYAKKDLASWQTYKAPTKGYDETVYNLFPYAWENGQTLAMLHTAAADKGVSLEFNINQLPAFSLWKNTDTTGQGYVTGLEPGTSFSYNRKYQRNLKGDGGKNLNLVPKIAPKETKDFEITYTLLDSKSAVEDTLGKIERIQNGRRTFVRKEPLVKLPQ